MFFFPGFFFSLLRCVVSFKCEIWQNLYLEWLLEVSRWKRWDCGTKSQHPRTPCMAVRHRGCRWLGVSDLRGHQRIDRIWGSPLGMIEIWKHIEHIVSCYGHCSNMKWWTIELRSIIFKYIQHFKKIWCLWSFFRHFTFLARCAMLLHSHGRPVLSSSTRIPDYSRSGLTLQMKQHNRYKQPLCSQEGMASRNTTLQYHNRQWSKMDWNGKWNRSTVVDKVRTKTVIH